MGHRIPLIDRRFIPRQIANYDVGLLDDLAKKCLATSSNRGGRIMRYAIVIEKGENSYGAYVPDLPGCVAVAETLEELKKLIVEAIAFHIEGLKEDGLPIPEPTSQCEYVEA